MSETENGTHSIGDEIPYRRDQMDKKTGSLVFDQKLGEKQSEGSERSEGSDQTEGLNQADVPVQTAEQDMPDRENPLERGQVT